MKKYIREGQVAERPHLNLPNGTYEEEIGLDGFFGPVSHLYSRKPPTSWKNIKKSDFQWPAKIEAKEDFLKPQCYRPEQKKMAGISFPLARPCFGIQILLFIFILSLSHRLFILGTQMLLIFFFVTRGRAWWILFLDGFRLRAVIIS